MICKILGDENINVTSFEYCSILGFLALILNPVSLHKEIQGTREESLMIIIDSLTIGLLFRYCYSTSLTIQTPFVMVTMISSCCNGFCHLLNIYILNYQDHMKKLKAKEKLTTNSVFVPIGPPTIQPPSYSNC